MTLARCATGGAVRPGASDSRGVSGHRQVASEEPLVSSAAVCADARAVPELHGAPERLTIDIDATLITVHYEKESAAGTTKRLRVPSAAGVRGRDP